MSLEEDLIKSEREKEPIDIIDEVVKSAKDFDGLRKAMAKIEDESWFNKYKIEIADKIHEHLAYTSYGEDGIQIFKYALNLDSYNLNSKIHLATAYKEQKLWEEFREVLNELKTVAPNNEEVISLEIRLLKYDANEYGKSGDLSGRIRTYERLIKLGADTEFYKERIKNLYLLNKQFSKYEGMIKEEGKNKLRKMTDKLRNMYEEGFEDTREEFANYIVDRINELFHTFKEREELTIGVHIIDEKNFYVSNKIAELFENEKERFESEIKGLEYSGFVIGKKYKISKLKRKIEEYESIVESLRG